MSFTDVIKKSVLENFSAADMSATAISVILIETFIIAAYIFVVYRYVTRTTFYNKGFAVSMSIISVITAGIILAMQSNLVISLGMVGALSIVRFRTAIKEPMDLLFLFWSIGTGIVVGAGLFAMGVIMAAFVTIGIVILDMVPMMTSPELLIVKVEGSEAEKRTMTIVDKYADKKKVDSKSVTAYATTLIIEVKTKDGSAMVDEIAAVDGVTTATLMKHDGEVKC
ncbi:protein of unknown function [Pseudobutyrivibrio sp. 49]|uniref:DUF4956 domain-containing protein n=1 Tax=unclassified Pseudobutyrivibrio TaxID=2638619 RepID=UPI000891AE9E|nr:MULTISPECIES: DUF4956 domain-containing protein [unclassified Pseudobutyrivibrio]SDH57345.1 protein of unknown function [Pseudobutyrivibrio sp. 49]SFO20879.1 protein of unknown function [Pseudobutyrivibrio sp. UC1225]